MDYERVPDLRNVDERRSNQKGMDHNRLHADGKAAQPVTFQHVGNARSYANSQLLPAKSVNGNSSRSLLSMIFEG